MRRRKLERGKKTGSLTLGQNKSERTKVKGCKERILAYCIVLRGGGDQFFFLGGGRGGHGFLTNMQSCFYDRPICDTKDPYL
jgi:hypothetical protein